MGNSTESVEGPKTEVQRKVRRIKECSMEAVLLMRDQEG